MGKTRAEVARIFTEALRDIGHGMIAPRDERRTLGAYQERWLLTRKPEEEPGYWMRCEQYVRLHIKPALGRTALVQLSARQLSTLYARKLAEGLASNTVRHIHAVIHTALEDALRLDLGRATLLVWCGRPRLRTLI
jgi:integrase